MKILVTGAAGFIGFHLILSLLRRGDKVIGIDNLNDYYSKEIKNLRLEEITKEPKKRNFKFIKSDISNKKELEEIFKKNKFDVVINLAAQAGVRYSLDNPHVYAQSNLLGFVNLIENCRNSSIDHLIYASSSSVYGMNKKKPFSTNDVVDNPVSLYAATKKSNELMAHAYSHLFDIPSTGLRFFTAYGPYGRPDMAYYKFTKAILEGEIIDVYNNGEMMRDFTFIDDVVEVMLLVIDNPPKSQLTGYSSSNAPHKILNIGNNKPIKLKKFIEIIENVTKKKAIKNYLPMQSGDVPITFANIDPLIKEYKFKPKVSIEEGIERFILWYKESKINN